MGDTWHVTLGLDTGDSIVYVCEWFWLFDLGAKLSGVEAQTSEVCTV